MYGIDLSLEYNSSVLQYVSGGTNNGSTVKIVEVLSGETSKSFSVTFKAIAAGSGSLSLSGAASGEGKGSAAAGAAVNVTAPQPSSNANLGSIKLSDGTLSPEFKQSTTSYSAKVKYQTEKITISANAAAGDSVVSGLGTFDLKVGDNSFSIGVTAASGDKKTYTVVVNRMTEEETAAAVQAERDSNPSLITVDGADYFIHSDLSPLASIEGYTVEAVPRKGSTVNALCDNAGKYKLFWATDANGESGAFYSMDGQGEFTRINYIMSDDKLYVLEPFEEDLNVMPGFISGAYDLNGAKISCYKYDDKDLSDFYIFKCYVNGQSEYYRYDALEGTLQREPRFLEKEVETVSEKNGGLLDKFNQLGTQAKIIVCLLLLAAVLVIALAVLLIIKAVSRKNGDLYETEDGGETGADPLANGELSYDGDENEIAAVGEPEDEAGQTADSEFLDPDD